MYVHKLGQGWNNWPLLLCFDASQTTRRRQHWKSKTTTITKQKRHNKHVAHSLFSPVLLLIVYLFYILCLSSCYVIFYLLPYLLFAGDKEGGREEDEEGWAVAAVNEYARGEEASAKELAAAKIAAEKDVGKRPPPNRWVTFLIFSTLAFPWFLTLLLLVSFRAPCDAKCKTEMETVRGWGSGGQRLGLDRRVGDRVGRVCRNARVRG